MGQCLGVLGWGVRGIELRPLCCQPVSMLIPEVGGFQADRQAREGIGLPLTLVLTVTQIARSKGVVGQGWVGVLR